MSKKLFGAAARAGRIDAGDLKFVEIGRDAPDFVAAQLAGNDLVHIKGTGDVEELRRFRLGGEGYDRTCYALIDRDKTVHSAIYVLKTYNDIHSDRHLHGDIAGTLTCEVREDARSPSSLIFYSISNITKAPGAGQNLVRGLHDHLSAAYPDAKRSTLSPLRSFDRNFSNDDFAAFQNQSMERKAYQVLDYILSGDRESDVQQFHLGNGARIADIKLDAGDVSVDRITGSVRRHFAMVNYAYDMDGAQLAANAEAFREVKRLIRNTDMDPELRAVSIRYALMPLVSDVILEDTGIKAALAMHGGRPRGARPPVLGL